MEVDADCIQIVIYETSKWKEKGKMKVCPIVPVKKSGTIFRNVNDICYYAGF